MEGESETYTVFIGGLSYDTKVQGLINFLTENGVHPIDTRIITRNEQSKGFGYADFSSEEESAKCIELNGQELDGRTIRCEVDSPGGRGDRGGRGRGRGGPRGGRDGGGRGRGGRGGGGGGRFGDREKKNFDNETPTRLLMLKNLSWDTDDKSLQAIFPDAIDHHVCRYNDTGRSRGFAFVEFDDIDSATKNREANLGKEIDQRAVDIVFATPREERGGSRGGRD